MISELDLVEDRDIRERLAGQIEVLDKVKELHMLENTEYMTTSQVANYYEVDQTAVRQINVRHRDELQQDGVKHYKHKDIKNLVNSDNLSQLGISPNGSLLFPKRAVLRVGMLLRDSDVAREVRTLLLNVYNDVENNGENISDNIAKEYDDQMELYMQYGKAISEGNMQKVVEISTAINEIKNKRIKETEDKLAKSEQEKEEMAKHSTTIQESRQVIRRIVNIISSRKYGNNFARGWSELHDKANYMLGINIRKRGGSGSLLHKYTNEETQELEVIAKNWAVNLGIDLDDILQL